MKCIKEKCKYCNTHDFYFGYYSCYIGGSFEKDNKDVSCVINSKIEDIEISLRDIKEYKEFIKKNQ